MSARKMKKNIIYMEIVFALVFALLQASAVFGAADFAVNSFSCTPGEAAINEIFSCTVQIKNNGDAAGSVSTATLFPDSNNWLEQASYAQASGASVSPGQTTEVTFSGLRAVKAGNNGFLKITLDQVTDTFVADNNVKQNVIDVSVSVSNSASSANMGQSFTTTAQTTAGGNIDVTLTWTRVSGGCGIGNQASQKSISGMQNGNKQSRDWTVTQGTTSGDCKFTITAAATGANGLASKTDALTSTVLCPNCPVSSSSTGTGSGGGGGGGGGAASFGELNAVVFKELGKEESFRFLFGGSNHTLMLLEFTETTATIRISSESQIFTLTVGDEKQVDFEKDGKNDISIKLKSINIITKKALFVLTPLYIPEIKPEIVVEEKKEEPLLSPVEKVGEAFKQLFEQKGTFVWIVLVVVVGVLAVIVFSYLGWIKHKKEKLRKAVRIAFEPRTRGR